jgi:TrmH RNA methyltransferase
VGNDHNLGAIARAAAFFDVFYIILNENDSEARLTTSAFRVAEGGFEHLTVRTVRDTGAFLRDASRQLVTVGTDTRARQRIGDLPGMMKDATFRRGRRGVALVLGNEETGLPRDIKDRCSCLLRIPGTGNIESLNVAQAAALFLYTLFEL